jgi:hypothetical protein
MDVNASAIAAQTAIARSNASLGFIKNNADTEAAIADVVSQAADQGAAAASGGRGSIVDISV